MKKSKKESRLRASVSAQSHRASSHARDGCDDVVCSYFGVTDRHNSCFCQEHSQDGLCQSSAWLSSRVRPSQAYAAVGVEPRLALMPTQPELLICTAASWASPCLLNVSTFVMRLRSH